MLCITITCTGCSKTHDKDDVKSQTEPTDGQVEQEVVTTVEPVKQYLDGSGNWDSLSVEMKPDSAYLCKGECIDIAANVTGGSPPYHYSWNNRLPTTAGPHKVCPERDTTYQVDIIDTGLDTDEFKIAAQEVIGRITIIVDRECQNALPADADIDANIPDADDSGDSGTTDSSIVPIDSGQPGDSVDSGTTDSSVVLIDSGQLVVKPYMVSIDTRVNPSRLLKIDLATGAGTQVCELSSPFDTYGYNSVAFDTEGQLIMSNYTNYSIDRMDPCTCTISEVGNTGFTNIPGLAVDGDGNIYGIEMDSNTLLKIDPESGEGIVVGSLGISIGSTGLAWDQHYDLEDYDLYAIDGYDNVLYGINSQTGLATLVSEITGADFGGVGVEIHRTTGELYGCTTDAILYQLNKQTGVATAIGSGMGHSSDCNNLAAPLGPIPCLDQL